VKTLVAARRFYPLQNPAAVVGKEEAAATEGMGGVSGRLRQMSDAEIRARVSRDTWTNWQTEAQALGVSVSRYVAMNPAAVEEATARVNYRAWFYTALRNTWKDWLRWRKRQPETISLEDVVSSRSGEAGSVGDLLFELGAIHPGENPLQITLNRYTKERVREAVEQIEEPFRTTAILKYVLGYQEEEIAARLSKLEGRDPDDPISRGTIAGRVRRARQRLVEILKDDFAEDVAGRPDLTQGRRRDVERAKAHNARLAEGTGEQGEG
jgi:RNA polymerase sigma factor (sigma-70 family)